MVPAGHVPIFVGQAHTIKRATTETGETIMFTKITMALAIILGVTSGAFAATTQQHSPDPAWQMSGSAPSNLDGRTYGRDDGSIYHRPNRSPSWE